MTSYGAVWKQLLGFHQSSVSLFYLSPVATCSSVFYLDMHSNWTTFRDRFIILVILSEPFSSRMTPNMLSQNSVLCNVQKSDKSMMHFIAPAILTIAAFSQIFNFPRRKKDFFNQHFPKTILCCRTLVTLTNSTKYFYKKLSFKYITNIWGSTPCVTQRAATLCFENH